MGNFEAYLEAEYNCRPGFEKKLLGRNKTGHDKLICYQGQWVGQVPACVKMKEKRRILKQCSKHDCDQMCRMRNGKPVCLCFKGFKLHGNKCAGKIKIYYELHTFIM